ncbi:MAG: serine/threonine protein kinase [Labilithrix sp.]|nr:serine/threonine protein kinase [Labilithrix sp.]
MPAVLVARFELHSQVAPIVRAALDGEIVYVALPEAPPPGRRTLQLWVGDALIGALAAELVGSPRDGEYPLRVAPIDPAHVPELAELAGGDELPASHAEDRTLASRADEDRTLSSAVAPEPVDAPPSSSPQSDEISATTVFDPESSVPRGPREAGTMSEDRTLTFAPQIFNDEESQTLPGQSTRAPGSPDVSWNVRQAPTTQDPLCGRIIGGGKYTLDSVIGSGASGIVFKASHRDLGRTVAIKVLNPRYRDDPGLLEIFRTEARAASQLEHPNVARVYDYGQEEGLVYIVMEYLSGYTLGSVIGARRRLAPSRALDVMIQICAGLSAAHDREIVHRDVKPDNVVLVPAQDDEGQPMEIVKVCDFGIAALGVNVEGVAAGTPEYMAPEQTTGSPATPAADVYACGVVLYEMLAGEVPFTSDQAYRILMKHRSEAPRPPSMLTPGLPAALEAVILRCLEKAPERRFKSARELRLELRKLADAKS